MIDVEQLQYVAWVYSADLNIHISGRELKCTLYFYKLASKYDANGDELISKEELSGILSDVSCASRTDKRNRHDNGLILPLNACGKFEISNILLSKLNCFCDQNAGYYQHFAIFVIWNWEWSNSSFVVPCFYM